ncbi:MAG: hypothetical protein WBD81_17900 [Collimonas pratensis]|uniref:hypothetical protein n=1 Tax=Collimonas pratensis TaxID=279113 RepID=UPI003C72C65D
MHITLKTIPHNQQRYETCGDWQIKPDGSFEILVSDMGNEKYAALVALHELCEVLLCQDRGITDESVTAFDEAYEAQRPEGDESEPGDSPAAPYAEEHCAATGIERVMASLLNVKWADYEKAINSLPERPVKQGAFGPIRADGKQAMTNQGIG